eukprot:s396_g17.t1
MPRTPKQFIEEAVSKGHPRNLIARVPEKARVAIDALLNKPMHERFRQRAKFFSRWLKRSLELKKQEAQLHASMPPHLQRVLKDKKLLLWNEILVDLEYPDASALICFLALGSVDDAATGNLNDSQDNWFGADNLDFSFVDDLMQRDNAPDDVFTEIEEAGAHSGLDRYAKTIFSPTAPALF